MAPQEEIRAQSVHERNIIDKPLVPREEVKAQHSRMQKMHALPRFVDSFSYEYNARLPFGSATPFFLSLVGNPNARQTLCAISPHCW